MESSGEIREWWDKWEIVEVVGNGGGSGDCGGQ